MAKIYMIDSENVGDSWIQLLSTLTSEDRLFVFYTDKSPYISYESLLQVIEYGSIPVFIKCHEGRNALDFQLVSELGYKLSRMPEDEFIIVSDDNGYDAVIKYWSEKKFQIHRMTRKVCRSIMPSRKSAVMVTEEIREEQQEEKPEGSAVRGIATQAGSDAEPAGHTEEQQRGRTGAMENMALGEHPMTVRYDFSRGGRNGRGTARTEERSEDAKAAEMTDAEKPAPAKSHTAETDGVGDAASAGNTHRGRSNNRRRRNNRDKEGVETGEKTSVPASQLTEASEPVTTSTTVSTTASDVVTVPDTAVPDMANVASVAPIQETESGENGDVSAAKEFAGENADQNPGQNPDQNPDNPGGQVAANSRRGRDRRFGRNRRTREQGQNQTLLQEQQAQTKQETSFTEKEAGAAEEEVRPTDTVTFESQLPTESVSDVAISEVKEAAKTEEFSAEEKAAEGEAVSEVEITADAGEVSAAEEVADGAIITGSQEAIPVEGIPDAMITDDEIEQKAQQPVENEISGDAQEVMNVETSSEIPEATEIPVNPETAMETSSVPVDHAEGNAVMPQKSEAEAAKSEEQAVTFDQQDAAQALPAEELTADEEDRLKNAIHKIVEDSGSPQPDVDAGYVYALFGALSMDNLTEVNVALKILFGNEVGNTIYVSLRERQDCRALLKKLYVPSQKERFLGYVCLVRERSDLRDVTAKELGEFLWKIPRKNLNSIRALMQKEYGRDMGAKVYSVYKAHIKVLNKI